MKFIFQWEDYGKHLGNLIDNEKSDMTRDLVQKRARYIQKNNQILQEFSFANPCIKYQLNSIYNMSFSGSPLWNLFSDAEDSLEKTFNISVRIMYSVPRDCHKYLIEPITEQPHLKFILIKRFLNFRKQVLDGPKTIVKNMFNICQYNSNTVTSWIKLKKNHVALQETFCQSY